MNRILAIIIFLSAIWACQDLTSINPPAELNLKGRYGEYIDTTIYATRDTFLLGDPINTTGAPKLSLGKFHNLESSILLKFVYLPDSTSLVDSVYIELNGLKSLGDATSDMVVSIYEADYEWDGSANLEDQWHNYTPGNKIKDVIFSAEDSSRYKIAIDDSSIYNQWFRDGDSNKGLFIRAENATYIKELGSFEYYYASDYENYIPRIIYRIYRDSVFVHDTLYTGIDATIFDHIQSGEQDPFTAAKENNDLVIASGITAHTLIQFDGLSSLPKNAVIQSASLQIPLKNESFFTPGAENELMNTNNSQGFYLRSVEEATDDLSYYKVDSIFTSSSYIISLSRNDSTLAISDVTEQVKFGRNYIQNIINKTIDSKWFYFQYISQQQDISVCRLKDLAEEPARIRIKYFLVDKTDF
jgi:hypothetical protein